MRFSRKTSRKSSAAAARKHSTQRAKPKRTFTKTAEEEDSDVGPGPRIRAWIEQRFGRLGADGRTLSVHPPNPNAYIEALRAWRAARAASKANFVNVGSAAGAPTPPPATNWIPIGPSVVRRGQATGAPPVSGRTVDIAIAPGGMRVYAATANGGVWRSDNGGTNWRPLMDSVNLAPTHVDSDSLACGAVAINPSNPDRIYVGTGEGDSSYFFNWVLGVVYSYAGVGPLRNDLGGDGPWINEPVTAGSPTLNGQAFFQLAVDPTDSERVVGATTAGIYRREPDGVGGHQWTRRQAGNCSSVVVARAAGVTSWFAAMYGGAPLTSADGATWAPLGTGFPGGVQRVSLAVQPTNTNTVYAFSSAGVHRLDISNGTWRVVTSSVTVDAGNYCAAIAVDPSDVTRIFLGAYGGVGGGASITRGVVSSSGLGAGLTYSMASTSLGSTVHPDVHRVVVRTDATNEMWIACDGGVFRTTTAAGAAAFESRNVDLATMTCTFLDHHPTEAAVVFCGAQDNGTLRYTGEEAWLHSADGDGGPVVVNWNDPYKILRTYVYGAIDRATDGGIGPGSWSRISPASSGALFYPPLVGTPRNPAAPAEAERVATGADRTWFSDDFGTAWSTPDTAALSGTVSALAFANANRVYAGTTTGSMYLYTRSGAVWAAASLIGQVGGGASAGLAPIVTDIAVDSADSTGASFYVTLGGTGDWRRVWHYDGTNWAARSGPSAGAVTSLINIDFNAIATDPSTTLQLFVGADIGVWRSIDGGMNWTAYVDGLPESGISDLKLHPIRRLLRAVTYGRGVWERAIDATSANGIELYLRDTTLDVGRWSTVDWLSDPESGVAPHAQVRHWESPNLKVDPPASSGTYQTTRQINYFQFVDRLVDGSEGVATVDPAVGTAVNRVYLEVHNRGVETADGVQVMLLVGNASAGLSAAPLPSGYASNVQSGLPISNANWQTVGIASISGLRIGVPQVVEFDLPSTMLPPPSGLATGSHYCLLGIVHHALDQFNSMLTNADDLTIDNRKVTQRNVQVVAFTGTLPPPAAPSSPLESVSALIDLYASGRRADLVIEISKQAGPVTLLLPPTIDPGVLSEGVVGGKLIKSGLLDPIVTRHSAIVERMLRESRASAVWTRSAMKQLKTYYGGTAIRFRPNSKKPFVGIKDLMLAEPATALLVFDAPHGAKLGDSWEVAVMLVQAGGIVAGGNTYRCRVALPPDDDREVQLEVELKRSAGRSEAWLGVRLGPKRKPGKGGRMKNAHVSAVAFTALGMVQPPTNLTWDSKCKAFIATISRTHNDAVIRRLTIVGRIGKLEGRRTIDLVDLV